jgi:hypothetical protein
MPIALWGKLVSKFKASTVIHIIDVAVVYKHSAPKDNCNKLLSAKKKTSDHLASPLAPVFLSEIIVLITE